MSKKRKKGRTGGSIAIETPEECRSVAQVSSKSLIPPTEPDEVTEADVDFKSEKDQLDAKMKALKAEIAALSKKTKQAVGGKKLTKMRKYAEETTAWAQKATKRFVVSVNRANTAVGNLQEYEKKLGIEQVVGRSVAQRLIEDGCLDILTDVVETLGQGLLESAKKKAAKS